MKFNSLDYLIMIILIVSIIQGYRKGLIGALGGIVSTLGALLVAYLFREQAAVFLEKTFGLLGVLPAALEKKAQLPVMAGGQAGLLTPISNMLHTQFVNIAHLIIVTISFVLLFIITSFVIRAIFKILEGLFSWSGLGPINRLTGIVVVLAKNLVIIAVVMGILVPLLDKGANAGVKTLLSGNTYIQGSVLAPYLIDVYNTLEKIAGISV